MPEHPCHPKSHARAVRAVPAMVLLAAAAGLGSLSGFARNAPEVQAASGLADPILQMVREARSTGAQLTLAFLRVGLEVATLALGVASGLLAWSLRRVRLRAAAPSRRPGQTGCVPPSSTRL